MADPYDILPTPANYATPQQIASMLEYGKALQAQSLTAPVHHWTQGVANIVKALVGGSLGHDADVAAQARQSDVADIVSGVPDPTSAPGQLPGTAPGVPSAVPPGPAAPGLPPRTPAPPPGVPPNIAAAPGALAPGAPPPDVSPDLASIVARAAPGMPGAPGASTVPSDRAVALASIETKGVKDPYTAQGPVVERANRPPDRAYGKYQVMGTNVGPWTKEVLGQEMTPQQFLASPEAQERVFAAKFGQFEAKYGNPQDAASVWFTGKPLAAGRDRTDRTATYPGMTGQEYVDRFTRALGVVPPATGAPTPATPPAPALALAGGPAPDAATLTPGMGTTASLASAAALPASSVPGPPPQAVASLPPPGGTPTPAPVPAPSAGPPQLPQEAQRVAQALLNASPPDAVGRVMVPMPAGLSPQQQAAMIRMGYDLKDVAELAKIRAPQVTKDDWGNEWALVPGQPPVMVKRGPGRWGKTKLGEGLEMDTLSNVGPDGQVYTQIMTPGGRPQQPGAAPQPGAPTTPTPGAPPTTPGQPGAPAPRATPNSELPPFPANGTLADIMEYNANRAAHAKGLAAAEEERSKALGVMHGAYITKMQHAPAALQQIYLAQHALDLGGPGMFMGSVVAPAMNEFKKLVGAVTGQVPDGTAPAEILQKVNTYLGIESAKELTNRPTQFDFKTILAANPGLEMSYPAARYMLNVLGQQQRQNIELSQIAASIPTKDLIPTVAKYYAEHPLVSPVTKGKDGQPLPLTQENVENELLAISGVTKDMVAQRGSQILWGPGGPGGAPPRPLVYDEVKKMMVPAPEPGAPVSTVMPPDSVTRP